MGALRIAAATLLVGLAAAAPAAAAPGLLGSGDGVGVAAGAADAAHVAWLAPGGDAVEYCRVPRGRRACAVRQTFALPASGIGDVQVLAPRPGNTVILVVATLNHPAVLMTSADGGATFASREIGELGIVQHAVSGPGETVALFSKFSSFARYGLDGSGPSEWAIEFAEATESIGNTLVRNGAGYAGFFSGAGGTRSVLWNGIGDPNLPQSWVEGPRMGGKANDPAAMSGPSGTWLAYSDTTGRRYGMYVRRLRSSGRLGRARRIGGEDITPYAAQGPRGDMIVLWRYGTDVVRYVRSRNGRRWTRPRGILRGQDTVSIRIALGRRAGWMAWDNGTTVKLAGLPRR